MCALPISGPLQSDCSESPLCGESALQNCRPGGESQRNTGKDSCGVFTRAKLCRPSRISRALEERWPFYWRSEEHTAELQSRRHLVCRLLLEQKKHQDTPDMSALHGQHR